MSWSAHAVRRTAQNQQIPSDQLRVFYIGDGEQDGMAIANAYGTQTMTMHIRAIEHAF